MAVDFEIVLNDAALRQLVRSPNGPAAKDLARRAQKVVNCAKNFASTGVLPGPNVDTGRLRSSITFVIGADAGGLFARVGTNVHYAPYLELGTRRMKERPFLAPALKCAT